MAIPIDPVCGKPVEHDALQQSYDGETFFFCSAACVQKFEREPKRFAQGKMKGPPTGQPEQAGLGCSGGPILRGRRAGGPAGAGYFSPI